MVGEAPRYLFTYGTLMRGEPLHAALRGAEFVGEFTTAPCFELVDCGGRPAVVRGGSTAIRGELYRVDVELLARTDEIEAHPRTMRREAVWIEGIGDVDCYVMRREQVIQCPRIRSGDWRRRLGGAGA
jgi:gamma-glutamylcyclotransferase (GGCT)/AIG2-like uncharacterized protein YtfP